MKSKRCFLLLTAALILVLSIFESLADWTYTVRRGDTLFKIARRYGSTVTAIRRRNGLNQWTVRIGQRIVIPTAPRQVAARGGWYYTVRRGDTLFKISRRVGLSVTRIRAANGWISSVRIGQRIIIPTGKATAATATRRTSSSTNAYLLAQLIHAEAESEPYAGKVAVGAVVLNRLENPRFPQTLAGVLYQPHAFESVTNGRVYNYPNTDSRRAAQAAINGWDPSGGAIFFFNPSKTSNRFIWSRRIINRIGKHVFAL